MIQIYQELPHADVIKYEYGVLAGRGVVGASSYYFPFVGEVFKETWQSLNMTHIEKSIQEAVLNQEYVALGMARDEFISLALSGRMPGVERLNIPSKDVQHEVYVYLHTMHMSFTDFDRNIINAPCGDGVW